MKKLLKFLISLLVTLGLLAAVFWKGELNRVLDYTKLAHPLPLLLALAVSFGANCCLATFKWRFILARLGLPLSFRETLLIKMGSLPLKSVLPLRAGEASRVVYLKRLHNFSPVKATASILLELFLNVLVFIFLIIAGGLAFRLNPGGVLSVLILAVGVLVMVAFTASCPLTRSKIKHLLGKIPSPRIRGGLENLLTVHRNFSYPQIAFLALISLAIQAGKLLSFFLINSSFSFHLPAGGYLVLLPLSILIATIPVSILGIGLREASLTVLLPQFYPVATAAVLGSALLFSAVEYVFPVILGLFWSGSFTARMIGEKK